MGIGLTLDDAARDSFAEEQDQVNPMQGFELHSWFNKPLKATLGQCKQNRNVRQVPEGMLADCRFASLCHPGLSALAPAERSSSTLQKSTPLS